MKPRLALLVACLMTQNAFALHPPSNDEMKRIQAYLDEAKKTQKEQIGPLQEKLKDVKRRGGDNVEINSYQNLIDMHTKERDLARSKAAHLTLKAYGIVPTDESSRLKMPRGVTVTNDSAKGFDRPWIVIAQDRKERQAQARDGSTFAVPPAKEKATATTTTDGVTTIYDDAFESPGLLAIILIHELDHFKQHRTRGKGDTMTTAEMEVAAYHETIRVIEKEPLGLTKAQKEQFAKNAKVLLKDNEEKVDQERRGLVNKAKRFLGWSKIEPAPFSLPHPESDLTDIQKQFDEIEWAFAQERKEMRKGREAREEAKKRQESVSSVLFLIAVKACQFTEPDDAFDGKVITQDELDRLPRVESVGACIVSNPISEDEICMRAVFNNLCEDLGLGRRITLESLKSIARPPKPEVAMETQYARPEVGRPNDAREVQSPSQPTPSSPGQTNPPPPPQQPYQPPQRRPDPQIPRWAPDVPKHW